MQKYDLKTWHPDILDNGRRVRINYEGSGVLLPLIDFRVLTDIKDYNDKLLENANRQNDVVKRLIEKVKKLSEENKNLAELAEIRSEAEKATYKWYNRNVQKRSFKNVQIQVIISTFGGAYDLQV